MNTPCFSIEPSLPHLPDTACLVALGGWLLLSLLWGLKARRGQVHRSQLRQDFEALAATIQAVVAAPAGGDSALQAQTVWQCQVQQDQRLFSGTLTILEPRGADFRGEMTLEFGQGRSGQYTFEGQVTGGHVAFLTDKKAGRVTFPGLYVGTVKGNVIVGTWRVPSYEQRGVFVFERREQSILG